MATSKSIYEPVNPHMSREQGLAAMHLSLSQIFNEKVELVERAFPLERYDDAAIYLISARDAFNKAGSEKMIAPLVGIAGSMIAGIGFYAALGRPEALAAGTAGMIGCLMWGAGRMIVGANREADIRGAFRNEVKPHRTLQMP